MKIYKIILTLASVWQTMALSSCSEDKFYDLGGQSSSTVKFMAVNIDIDRTEGAYSTSYDYYQLEENIRQYPLTTYLPMTYNGSTMDHSTFIAETERDSEIWSGGYNTIEITFFPSNEDEKEALFTMPDNTTHTATIDNPTFTWTPDSTMKQYLDIGRPEYTFIKAESRYTKGTTEYRNEGYVYINMNPYIRFNKYDGRWYQNSWLTESSISVYSYTQFTVENLTIPDQDVCVSYNPVFPETEIDRTDSFSIPYIGYGGTEHIQEISNSKSYYFYACGNNDLLFTFRPRRGEKEMILLLPDFTKITLTLENPTFVWHVDYGDLRSYNHEWISSESTYTIDGITYYCQSEVRLIALTNIYYDVETGVFRSEYYY